MPGITSDRNASGRSPRLSLLRFATTAPRDLGSSMRRWAGVEPARQGTYGGQHDADRCGGRRCCSRRRGDDRCLTGTGLGRTQPEAGLDAREGLRHLARVHVGTDVGADRGRRPRVAGTRRRTRRSGLDPLRGPSRMDHPRSGDRRRAGHHGRAVPDQPEDGGGVPARRLRRQDPPRRGPGTDRQGVPDRPPADPRPAADHLRRAAGPGRRRRRSALVLGELLGARSRAQARSTPERSPT